MDIDPEMVSYIITVILGLLATLMGTKWQKIKNLFSQSQQTTLKFAQALQVLSEAIEDDRITQKEAEAIVKSWKEVIDEAKRTVTTIKK